MGFVPNIMEGTVGFEHAEHRLSYEHNCAKVEAVQHTNKCVFGTGLRFETNIFIFEIKL